MCLGPLAAGRTYTTDQFTPTLSYAVPAAGWQNFEDTPGNFLLVPPGNDLPGVNAGTADFVGVYTAVSASRFSDLPSCSTSLVPRVSGTAKALAEWIGRRPGLRASKPTPVTVGGLTGVMTDVRARPGARLPTCVDNGTRVTVALLISGVSPSGLDHGIIAGMTMRLYLLDTGSQVLAIELDDIDEAPGNLASLVAAVKALRFHT